MNQVTVMFFATLKERTGTKTAIIALPIGARVKDLKSKLLEEYPALAASMTSVLVSINREFAFDEDAIPDNAEIALFPPVSGGSSLVFPTFTGITDEELDINQALMTITSPTTGAACIFTGVVREITDRHRTLETHYLEYEAYEPMVKEKMNQVVQEIRDQWPSVEGILIVQRIGRLVPGTPTVLIACSAAHRDTGVFDAARYGIDRLKEIVPVWKKEVGPQGEMWVEGDYIPSSDD